MDVSGARGTSRRRLLRASAWSVPAVGLAVGAPAAAAASPAPYLVFSPNGSGVRSGNSGLYWYYEFATDAGVIAYGADIPAAGLSMVVTFESKPDFSDTLLRSYGAPASWSAVPLGTTTDSIVYTYGQALPQGSTAVLGPGVWFAMDGNPNYQQGSFVFTISAPGFTGTTVKTPCPT